MQKQTNNQSQNQKTDEKISQNSVNKFALSFAKIKYDEKDSNNSVLVYLHSHNNKSLKLQLGPKISTSDLKKIIQDKIGIKKDIQLLYLNGNNITEYGHIRLQTHSIIHISNSDQICGQNQEIHLKLTIMNFVLQKQQKIHKEFVVQPNELVSNFLLKLQNEIRLAINFEQQNVYFYLLESSRLLQKQKTFQEQEITRSTHIICMITKHEVKTRFTNDTKQEILHDISELLGFCDQAQIKPQNKREERSIRPRYSSQQTKRTQIQQQPKQKQACNLINSLTLPNFKKKRAQLIKVQSFQDSPSAELAKKIKSSKTKKDLDYLLISQQRQKLVFQSPQTIKQQVNEQAIQEQPQQKGNVINEAPKTTPRIPKVMPFNQRLQIRLEIQKLFDLGDSSAKSSPVIILEAKEQLKPFSPPTEIPKQKQK